MKFCSRCGSPVALQIPVDDTRPRHVCQVCQHIHYLNPRNVVGSIPLWQEQVLLCRRAIEPRLGFWTLPAGFLEIGESTAMGAARETLEEAGAEVDIGVPVDAADDFLRSCSGDGHEIRQNEGVLVQNPADLYGQYAAIGQRERRNRTGFDERFGNRSPRR